MAARINRRGRGILVWPRRASRRRWFAGCDRIRGCRRAGGGLQELPDGAELHAGVAFFGVPVGESLLLGDEPHFGGRLAHGDHEPHDGVVVADDAGEVADGAEGEGVAAFDLDDDLAELAVYVPEANYAVDSAVRALLFAVFTLYEGEAELLEGLVVLGGGLLEELLGGEGIFGRADELVL